MLNLFAHAGHSHDMESVNGLSDTDYCLPIIIGAGVIAVILLAVIIYLLTVRRPKKSIRPTKKKASKDQINPNR